jgi:hypothetical protein
MSLILPSDDTECGRPEPEQNGSGAFFKKFDSEASAGAKKQATAYEATLHRATLARDTSCISILC